MPERMENHMGESVFLDELVKGPVDDLTFTHFLEFPFGSFFANLLVGGASPIPFERHLQCRLHLRF